MERYIKLYIVYLQRAIKSRLEYKKDAVVGIISFVISNTIAVLSIYFVIRNIPSLNGWSMYELGFLYGFSMLPKAIDHLLTDSLWYVGFWYVKSGVMDRFLIRPVNVLFQVIAEIVQPEAFGEIIVGVVLLVVCGRKITVTWTGLNLLLLVIAMLCGAVVFTSIKLITCSVAFWTKRSGQLMSMVYNTSDFSRYPLKIYHPVIQKIMTFIVPFGLVITMPIGCILKGEYPAVGILFCILLVTVVLFIFSYMVWCMGLKNYESSGS